MENVTLAEVMTAAKQLSSDEKWRLRSMLDEDLGLQNAFKSIEQLAREQGVKPRSFEELLGPEPEEGDDDDVDEFLRDVHETRGQSNGRKSIKQLMQEQGTRPLKFEEIIGDFWPEDENVDDFVNAVRELRQQTEIRSLE